MYPSLTYPIRWLGRLVDAVAYDFGIAPEVGIEPGRWYTYMHDHK